MSRINLPKHPLRPESPLMYRGSPVTKMSRRELMELVGLIASEQIEQVQDLGLNWHNPHRFSLPMSEWALWSRVAPPETYLRQAGLTAQSISENTCANGAKTEPQS